MKKFARRGDLVVLLIYDVMAYYLLFVDGFPWSVFSDITAF